MSKKIMVLLVLSVISMHNNFAMEKKPLLPFKYNKHTQCNGLQIKILPNLLGHLNKQTKRLNNQLQDLESNKDNLSKENDLINENIKKNRDDINRNRKIQVGLGVTGIGLDVLTGGIAGGLIAKPVIVLLKIHSDNAANSISDCESKLKENDNSLSSIAQDKSKIHNSLSKLKESKDGLRDIRNKKLESKAIRISLNNSYYQSLGDTMNINIMSDTPNDRSFQGHMYDRNQIKDRQEDSSDSSMKFCVSDDELSDVGFTSKRPYTKNGSRIVVCFGRSEDLSDSMDYIRKESVIDVLYWADISLDRVIQFESNRANNANRFGKNRDGSSDISHDLMSLMDRFYHHQYRFYSNKYRYYSKINEMINNYLCLSEYILKVKKKCIMEEADNDNICLHEIFYKGMLTLKSIMFQKTIW